MNFQIKCFLIDKNERPIYSGTFIAKNKGSKFEAMAGLEKYLLKKYPEAVKMKVTSCLTETLLGFMAELEEMIDRYK